MKKVLLIALAATFITGAFATESFAFKPAGRVTSYTQSEYNVSTKFGDYYRSPSSKFLHVLNANTGLETEVDEYTTKDVLLSKVIYQYDSSLNLTATLYYNGKEELIWKTAVTYNADGTKKDESEFDKNGKLIGRTIFKYSDKKTDESYYDANGKLLEKTITKYDGSRISEVVAYVGDGSLEERNVYHYNDLGKIINIEYYNEKNEYTGKKAWRYDEKGAVIEEQYFNKSNIVTQRDVYTYKNDVNGNPSRISSYVVAEKFGETTNELRFVTDYSYKY